MKKLLSLALSAMMLLSVFTGCAQNSDVPEVIEDNNAVQAAEDSGAVEEVKVSAGSVPEAKYHWDFESMDGLTPVAQVAKAADSINDGATYDIGAYDGETYIVENGAVGNCLYLDGNYGVKLDVEALNTDEYAISFWMHATRLSTYGPTLQIGRNMGDAADDRTVTWLNFTKSTWGAGGAAIFPVVWNRNSDTGVWPWVYANDNAVHGLDEWIMVTLVTDGQKYTFADDGLERIGCKFYLNGQLAFDASADLGLYGGISPEVLTGDGIEAYFGVNYWDTNYRGFVDDLYIFDKALTDEEVAALFAVGDASAATVTPVEEVDPVPPEKVIIDTNGYVYVENTDVLYDEAAMDDISEAAGWWSEFTETYEVPENSKLVIELNNQSQDTSLNWNNYVLVLCNVPTDGVTAPSAANYEGYAEYVCIRPDWYGWGTGYDGSTWEGYIDWATYPDIMANADVTIELIRVGDQVLINTNAVGVDSGEQFTTSVYGAVASGLDCYAFLTAENALVDLKNVTLYDIISGITEEPSEDETTSDSDVSDSDVTEDKTVSCMVPSEDVIYDNAESDDLASAGWWQEFSEAYELPDNSVIEMYFNNKTMGTENWNNFLTIFSTTPLNTEGYAEYAVVRADGYGWGPEKSDYYDNNAAWSAYWGDPDGDGVGMHYVDEAMTVPYKEFMKDAEVVVTATREDGKVYLDVFCYTVDEDGNVENYIWETASMTVPADMPCYLTLTAELAEIDMHSVELYDIVKVDVIEYNDVEYFKSPWGEYEDAAEDDMPAADFWAEFSEGYYLSEESMLEIKFHNASQGASNWNTYFVVLSDNTIGTEGNHEYAVVRADAYGWGAEYNADATWDVVWGDPDGNGEWLPYVDDAQTITFVDFMKDADVVLNIVRDGEKVVVNSTITGASGDTVTGSASAAVAAGLDCFVTIGNDHADIDMEYVDVYYEAEPDYVTPSDVVTSSDVVSSSDAE